MSGSGSSRNNQRNMDMFWDMSVLRDMDMVRDNERAEITTKSRRSTSLVRPWVVGEPLRWDKVLAAA